jgi:hypothetical protein
MNSSMSEDYFSFMSNRWEKKYTSPRQRIVAPPSPPLPSDTIEFVVEESQIEVTESIASDSMIQRIFNRYRVS